MKNRLSDLNNHLFAQLERLGDEKLKGEKLDAEVDRGKAITGIAKEVVNNAKLAFDVEKFRVENNHYYNINKNPMPAMLESSDSTPLENKGN